MTEKVLREYVDRMGMVALKDLVQQSGTEERLWRQPAIKLIEGRDVYFCRLDHGEETLLSRHLLFCMLAVYQEPELSDDAQDILDWLSDHELSVSEAAYTASGLNEYDFNTAFVELQQKLCVTPLMAKQRASQVNLTALSDTYEFLWVTGEYWMANQQRSARYKNLEYCLSEIRRLLSRRFTTREIDQLIYQGVL